MAFGTSTYPIDVITSVTVSAEVPSSIYSGNPITYSGISAVSDDPGFVFDEAYIEVKLFNSNHDEITDLNTPLSSGTYYLTITYRQVSGDRIVAYGTRTYTVTVTDRSPVPSITPGTGGSSGDLPDESKDDAGETTDEPGPVPGNIYDDVAETDWFYSAVMFMVEKGLMRGVSEDLFAPGADLTRAMLVTILYRLENEPGESSGSLFNDVGSGNWYSDAVAWAAASSIVTGYGNGDFGPEDSITREQLALILYNYARYKGYDISAEDDLDEFEDGDQTSSWAETAMKWAVKNGLLKGKGEGRLDPSGTATRAEVAEILMRFIKSFIE